MIDDIDKLASNYFRAALIGLIKLNIIKKAKRITSEIRHVNLNEFARKKFEMHFFNGVNEKIADDFSARKLTFMKANGKARFEVLRGRFETPPSEKVRDASRTIDFACNLPGMRRHIVLQPESLAVKVGGFGIGEYVSIADRRIGQIF